MVYIGGCGYRNAMLFTVPVIGDIESFIYSFIFFNAHYQRPFHCSPVYPGQFHFIQLKNRVWTKMNPLNPGFVNISLTRFVMSMLTQLIFGRGKITWRAARNDFSNNDRPTTTS